MSVLGELLVQINGDNSGLNKALSKSSQSVSDAANAMVQKIGGVALAWKAVQVAVDGIQYNAMKEQAEIAFGVFLGSADKAKAMIKSLQQVAIDTPLEFADVRDAGKQLLAYGVAAEDLVPTIKTLTDVSAGLNIPIKDLSYLYGTIKTQGRAMTVDINQFANRGIPIWDELAKVTGKNGTELRAFVEAGQVGFPIIEKAFQGMTSEGGKFYQMAVKQMDSFVGAQSNLSDATGIYLSKLTAGMMGPLKDGMISITKSMNDANKSSEEFGATLGKVFQIATAVITPVFDFLSKMPGEFTAIGIAAGIAFAVFGPWGAALAAIVVSVGAIGKAIEDANKKNLDNLTNSFLAIAEHSKMTAKETENFLYQAKMVEQALGNWAPSAKNVDAYFERIASRAGITKEQVANIALNSEATTAQQKEIAALYLKQNGLIAIGTESAEKRVENQKLQLSIQKDLEARYPKEAAAAAAKAASDKVALANAKEQADRQKALVAGQEDLAKKTAAISALQKATNSDQKVALEEQVKLRTDYLNKLEDEYKAGKISLSFMTSETQRINSLNEANLNTINKIERSADGTNTFLALQTSLSFQVSLGLTDAMNSALDLSDAVAEANGELKKAPSSLDLILKKERDQADAMSKVRAEFEKIAGGKIFDRILADAQDWSDITESVYTAITSVAKDGLEKIGASLVSGKDDWNGWAAVVDKALATVLEAIGQQLAAMAVIKALTGDWAGAALAGAGSIAAFVAAGALNAYADQLTNVASKSAEAAVALTQTTTATELLNQAVDRASTKLKSSSNTSAMTAQMTAQTEAIRAHYSGLVEMVIQAKMEAGKQYAISNDDLVSLYSQKGAQGVRDLITQRAKELAKADIDAINTQMQSDLDAIGYNLALFQERADEAGSNISKSFAQALKEGTSQADFTQSIMDMLRGMAIDAAILAGGFADKFKAIGAQIAEALQDGFQQNEVDTLKTTISDLYGQATSAVTQINTLFPGYAVGTASAPGGLSIVGEQGPELMNVPRGSQIVPAAQTRQLLQSYQTTNNQTRGDTVVNIQSNAPLDPLQTARAVQDTMESLAFAGVA